jgi:hypothetical protein
MRGHARAFHDEDRQSQRNQPDAKDCLDFTKKMKNNREEFFSILFPWVQRVAIFPQALVFDLEAVKKEGFTYYSIGRADVEQNRESAGS